MTVEFVAQANAQVAIAPTTCNVPAGTLDGDVMLAFEAINGAASAPAGWTLLHYAPGGYESGGDDSRSASYWRLANAEPASYAFANAVGACIASYRGVDPADPIAASNFTGHTHLLAQFRRPWNQTITRPERGCLVVCMLDRETSGSGGPTWVAPPGFVMRSSFNPFPGHTIQMRTADGNPTGWVMGALDLGAADAPDGPTGHMFWGAESGSGIWSTHTAALRPA